MLCRLRDVCKNIPKATLMFQKYDKNMTKLYKKTCTKLFIMI